MEKSKELQIQKDIYWFLWVVQRLIDNGKVEQMDKIINECDNGTLYDYLYGKYELEKQNNPFDIDSKTINYLYSNVGFSIGDINRKYLVHSNGLIYISVLAIEWLYTGFSHLY